MWTEVIRDRSTVADTRSSGAVTIPIDCAGVACGGALSNKGVQADGCFYLCGWCRFTKRYVLFRMIPYE